MHKQIIGGVAQLRPAEKRRGQMPRFAAGNAIQELNVDALEAN